MGERGGGGQWGREEEGLVGERGGGGQWGTERIGIVGKKGGGVSGERGRDSGEERRRD